MDDKIRSQDWLELYRPDDVDPDLGDPSELAELLSQSAELSKRHQSIVEADQRIEAALWDVAAPAGLQQRILAAIASDAAAASETDRRPLVAAVSDDSGPSRTRGKGRRWFVATGATATAAVLAWLMIGFPKPPALSVDMVAAEAMRLYENPGQLQPATSGLRLPGHFDEKLCRRVGTIDFLGYNARAYELTRSVEGVSHRVLLISFKADALPASLVDALPDTYSGSTIGDAALRGELFLDFFSSGDEMVIAIAPRKEHLNLFQKPFDLASSQPFIGFRSRFV